VTFAIIHVMRIPLRANLVSTWHLCVLLKGMAGLTAKAVLEGTPRMVRTISKVYI
jgi:hypothetical protein